MMNSSSRPSPPRQGTILVVEDEVRSQRLLRLNLEPMGYRVVTLGTAQGVEEVLEAHAPDLIVLDLRLPDGDGFEVCQRVRALSTVPIIMLSAAAQVASKVRGLELGADDYVTKPYDPVELAARIEAVLRRVRGEPLQQQAVFRSGPLCIDFEQRQVTTHGVEVRLSRTEYRLLEYLARNAGRTLVADALLAKVWGTDYMGDYASLHLYISRLRRKLGESSRHPRLILTKPGIGYMMPALAGES
jgi:DNA-binding response OmpR family regulator